MAFMPQTDFSVFRERLAEACRARSMTNDKLCASIGIGGRHAVEFSTQGIKALDLHRVCQIADRLNISLDWLLGRSDSMELPG